MKIISIVVVTICVVFMIAVPIIAFLFVVAPADLQYKRKFGTHVVMAYDQARFEGVREEVIKLWEEMNNTFGTTGLNEIYGTPWYWEFSEDNSLAAQTKYFEQLVKRIDEQIFEQQQILGGNRTIIVPYNQWYQEALEGLRSEMKREGGLDWALRPAWYLRFATWAYWAWVWVTIVEIILFTIIVVAFWKGQKEYY